MILAVIEPWLERTVAIAAILGLAVAWYAASRKRETRKIEPNPLTVKKYEKRASEKDCKERHGSLLTILETFNSGVNSKFEATEKDHDAEHRRIWGRIDEVNTNVSSQIRDLSNKVAGLERETENQNSWLDRIDQKLDTLINRKS